MLMPRNSARKTPRLTGGGIDEGEGVAEEDRSIILALIRLVFTVFANVTNPHRKTNSFTPKTLCDVTQNI